TRSSMEVINQNQLLFFLNSPLIYGGHRTEGVSRWSGIRRQDLLHAIPFDQAQKEIVKIITGKVVVGHAIHNDFKVLKYFHPACQTRDTAQIPLLNQKAGLPVNEMVSLKRLTEAIFKKDIQTGKGGHSSVEDAKATMELFKVVESMGAKTLSSQPFSSESSESRNIKAF
uniref:Interferon stimulated exonuclease gene 20-like 2 n=1 Tax=Cyprinus carpio TaxID=7962 RepID=A0A8C2A886_CYPCA